MINVVISPTADGSFPGGAPVVDLAPTSHTGINLSGVYSVIVFPRFLNGADSLGNRTVYITETYITIGVGGLLCYFNQANIPRIHAGSQHNRDDSYPRQFRRIIYSSVNDLYPRRRL